ncbi:MAG TPA: TolC family protein [Bryobacteraceae bacterium]|nr:TolC family protein [Bryobacteraceae bacterium]
MDKQKLLKPLALAILLAIGGRAQQTALPELTLGQAIEQALRNNASFTTAKLETRRAADDLAANRTRRFANTQIIAFGSQLLTRPSLTFSRGAFGNFPATGPIPATDQAITIARRPVGVIVASVTQPLSQQYKLHLQLSALSLGVAGSREDERKKRLETIDQVRRAYYGVVDAQSQLDSLEASLPYYRESNRLAVEHKKTETILESDLLRSGVQLLKTENSIGEAADQLAGAAEKLNDLMGRDIHTQFRVSDVSNVDTGEETPEAIETRALENRPDVKKAQLQVRQAAYDRRAKKAEYIPEVSLAINYLTTTNFGNTLPSNITAAGLQLTWEPWDWGRKRHEIAEKRLKEDEAKVAVDATERSVLLEVRGAWRQLGNARRQLALSDASQRAVRQKLHEVQEQVAREALLTKDLFSAQSDLASADGQHRQALAAFWRARANLKKATGEE